MEQITFSHGWQISSNSYLLQFLGKVQVGVQQHMETSQEIQQMILQIFLPYLFRHLLLVLIACKQALK